MSQPSAPPTPASPAIEPRKPSWHDSLAALWERRVLIMVLLGFSAGLPILLIFSSLSLWLVEAGVERKAVTFFSWAALGYSFKFVWAPLVDRMALPVLTGMLGQRRSWLLLAQAGVITAMVGMASVDPAGSPEQLSWMAAFAVLLGFSSASQDIVIDAYRIELAPPEMQALLSSAYIAGYRVGMIVAGAGALYLASYWGSTKELYVYAAWQKAYWVMAAAMGVGVLTALLMPEQRRPAGAQAALRGNLRLFLVFLGAVSAFVFAFFYAGPLAAALLGALGGGPLATLLVEALRLGGALAVATGAGWVLVRLGLADTAVARDTWVVPVLEFFERYGASTAWLVLALVGLYRISDIVLGVISNVFYADMGYSKIEIANAVKTFGVLDQHRRGLPGRHSGHPLWCDALPDVGGGHGGADQPGVCGAGPGGLQPAHAVPGGVRRQPGGRVCQRGVCGLSLQPGQRLVHGHAVRLVQLAHDLVAQVAGGLFGRHRGRHRLPRFFCGDHADGLAGDRAGVAGRAPAGVARPGQTLSSFAQLGFLHLAQSGLGQRFHPLNQRLGHL